MELVFHHHDCVCVHIQSTAAVDLAGGVAELDSDMADITQGFPTESMLGGEEDGDLPMGDMDAISGKLAGLISSDHDGVSASSHIASTLGINPHALQVESARPHTQEVISLLARIKDLNVALYSDHEGVSVC